MRLLLIAILTAFAVGVSAQTTQCVEVPENHKIVFIPWIIPVKELTWTWKFAKEPQTDVVVEPEECEDGQLVISPSVCKK